MISNKTFTLGGAAAALLLVGAAAQAVPTLVVEQVGATNISVNGTCAGNQCNFSGQVGDFRVSFSGNTVTTTPAFVSEANTDTRRTANTGANALRITYSDTAFGLTGGNPTTFFSSLASNDAYQAINGPHMFNSVAMSSDINGDATIENLLTVAGGGDFDTFATYSGFANTSPYTITTVFDVSLNLNDSLAFDAALADIPEPTIAALLGLGLIGFGLRKKAAAK